MAGNGGSRFGKAWELLLLVFVACYAAKMFELYVVPLLPVLLLIGLAFLAVRYWLARQRNW